MRAARWLTSWLGSSESQRGPAALLGGCFGALAVSVVVLAVGSTHYWIAAAIGASTGALSGAVSVAISGRRAVGRLRIAALVAIIGLNLRAVACTMGAASAEIGGAFLGILCGYAASLLVVRIALRIDRSPSGRPGSWLAELRQRRLWFESLVVVALLACVGGVVGRRSAVATLEALLAAGGMLAVVAVECMRHRSLRAASASATRHDGEPESVAWDLGVGDEQWWCSVTPSAAYRANERPRFVIRGALHEVLGTLRRAFRIEALAFTATLAATVAIGVHGARRARGAERLLATDGKGFAGSVCQIPADAHSVGEAGACEPSPSIRMPVLDVPKRPYERGFPGVSGRVEWFAVDFKGTFHANVPGLYQFRLFSDDGSVLWIDGDRVVNDDGLHEPTSATGSVWLRGGEHTVRVKYFQGPRDEIALELFVSPPLSSFAELLELGW